MRPSTSTNARPARPATLANSSPVIFSPARYNAGTKQYSGVQIEALRQRRRCDDDLEDALGQQDLQLAQERARQAAMVDGDALPSGKPRRDGLRRAIPCRPPGRGRSTPRPPAASPDSRACRGPRPAFRTPRPSSPASRRSGSACPEPRTPTPRTRPDARSCADRASSPVHAAAFCTTNWSQERTIVRRGPESEQASMPAPRQHPEPLARRPPIGPHRLARLVGAYPRGQIVQLVSARQDRREADDPPLGRVRAP